MSKRPAAYKKSGLKEPYSSTWNDEVIVYRGDDIIDQGTIKEVAERRGVQKRTIRYHLTPAGIKRADRRKKQHKTLRIVKS